MRSNMVRLSDEEFNEVMSNFNEFMELHGYTTVNDMADNVWFCTPSCIRQMVHDCRLKEGIVHLNEKTFIKKDMQYPQKRMVTDAPPGFLTVKDYSNSSGVLEATIRTKIYNGRMPEGSIVRKNNRWYVKDGTVVEVQKSKAR